MKRVLAAVVMTTVSLSLVRSQTQIIGEDCACEAQVLPATLAQHLSANCHRENINDAVCVTLVRQIGLQKRLELTVVSTPIKKLWTKTYIVEE